MISLACSPHTRLVPSPAPLSSPPSHWLLGRLCPLESTFQWGQDGCQLYISARVPAGVQAVLRPASEPLRAKALVTSPLGGQSVGAWSLQPGSREGAAPEGRFEKLFPEARPGCWTGKNNRCSLKQGIFLSGTGCQLQIHILTPLLAPFLAAVVGMAFTLSVHVPYFSPLSGDTGGGVAVLAQGLRAGTGAGPRLSDGTQGLAAAVRMPWGGGPVHGAGPAGFSAFAKRGGLPGRGRGFDSGGTGPASAYPHGAGWPAGTGVGGR